MTRTARPTRRYNQTARAQAAEETGQRIVEAFIGLLHAEWYDRITLDRVAELAGVSVQTIVRRFGSKDGLLAGSMPTLSEQVASRRATPAGDDAAYVRNLVADYEALGDGVIRLLALEERHEAVGRMVDIGRRQHRAWVREQFATLLAGVEEAERESVVDALVVATDVYTWKLLRRDRGHGVDETARIVLGLVQAIGAQHARAHNAGAIPVGARPRRTKQSGAKKR